MTGSILTRVVVVDFALSCFASNITLSFSCSVTLHSEFHWPSTMESTQLITAANWIRNSSSILIAAGAGLSASAVSDRYGVALDYTSVAAFRHLYPRMTQVSTMRCMYDAIGKQDWKAELMWGYLLTHVNKCRYDWGPTSVYQDLKQIVARSSIDSFVVTTNADGMFEQNQFVSFISFNAVDYLFDRR
jgi:hypothetical protein